MRMFRFILYVIKKGTLKNDPINFNDFRHDIIKGINIDINIKRSYYTKIRGKLARRKFLGPLIGNLAYLKSARKISTNYFLIDSIQIGYVRILKSASTSVLKGILPLIAERLKNRELNDKEIDTLAYYYTRSELTDQQKQFKLFTIVRNPFERLVSVYLDLFDKRNPYFAYEGYLFGILKRTMTFAEFINVLGVIPNSLKAPHFASQYQILNYCGGVEKVKYFRLEKDSQALDVYLKSFGISISHSNSHRHTYDYKSFYNAEILNQAHSIYKIDMDTFDYRDEYESLKHYVQDSKT